MKTPSPRRYRLSDLLSDSDAAAKRSEEELAWLEMAPVGLELGSREGSSERKAASGFIRSDETEEGVPASRNVSSSASQ